MDKTLIAYACGAGAKDDGCKDAPAKLLEQGLAEEINATWLDIYQPPTANKSPLQIVTDHCQKLCDNVSQTINNGHFPIAIGGDHSMAIGTWSGVTHALDAKENFGLIWFDAHMDAHTPQSSESGSYHGMPLACLLGSGEAGLRSIASADVKLNPSHICLIGIRSFEAGEAKLLNDLGVRIYYIDEVNERGLKTVTQEALQIVKNGTKAYGVTIDIDAFDPSDAPGTGTKETNGLRAQEALTAFSLFANDPDLRAIEIAEYNHYLGKEGITSKLIFDLLKIILK